MTIRKRRALAGIILILLACWLFDQVLDRAAVAWSMDLPGVQDRDLPIRFTFLSPAQLKQMMNAGADFTLLDVREQGEFRRGHIDGAVNIPFHQIAERAGELDAAKPLVVYCIKAGRRSIIAANTLSDLGFTSVYNVDGGIAGWEKAFPLSPAMKPAMK